MSAVIGSMAKKGSLKKKTSSVVVAAKGIKKRVLKKPAAKGRALLCTVRPLYPQYLSCCSCMLFKLFIYVFIYE